MTEFLNLKSRITLLEDLEWIVKSKDRVIEDLSNKILKWRTRKLNQEKTNPTSTIMPFRLSDLFNSNGKSSNYDIAIIEKVARESKSKENKASNIIISGIAESKNENTSDIEEDDKLATIDLLKELGIAPSGNFVKKAYRISKTRKENKPALLKVELKDKEAANNIIMRAKKLKEIERYRGVYINRDLTKNEIEVERAGRKECLERNEKLEYGQGRHKYGIDYSKTQTGIEYFWGLRSEKAANTQLAKCQELNEQYQILQDFITLVLSTSFKSTKYSQKWFNNDIKKLTKRKYKLHLMMRSRNGCLALKDEYKSTCKELKILVKLTRMSFEKKIALECKNNPKVIYSYINNQRKSKDRIRSLANRNGDLI
ncbi:hypothetical protein BpHYR1_037216, partial [Brachionus plicatilis]